MERVFGFKGKEGVKVKNRDLADELFNANLLNRIDDIMSWDIPSSDKLLIIKDRITKWRDKGTTLRGN